MKIMLDEGAYMPARAHEWDAGLDLYAMEEQWIPGECGVEFNTGVHLEIPKGFVGLVKSRSGLMMKQKITTDGVVDAGYTGAIRVMLFNHGIFTHKVNRGDKIAQLVIVPCLIPELEVVERLDETDRGDNGFGSTGR